MDAPATAPADTTGRVVYADETSFSQHTSGYLDVASQARERGLLQRTPWFYWGVSASLVAAFGGCLTGFLLLGDSWFQLLIAAALGLVFTQTAFLAHEAAHRQILSFGPGNDRLARVLAAAVGLSYSWWHSKHSRHHGNPNRVGKDPDIEPDT
ncbi:acyl-CoA desaturase, partial [Galactobacter valiniphilus]